MTILKIDSILAYVPTLFYRRGMENGQELRETICSHLLAKAGDKPINLVLVGPDLIAAGYREQEIVNALFWLIDARRVELVGSNMVRLTPSYPPNPKVAAPKQNNRAS